MRTAIDWYDVFSRWKLAIALEGSYAKFLRGRVRQADPRILRRPSRPPAVERAIHRWNGERSMSIPTLRADGKVVVVTGGSKGLGRAMALGFAEAGADVVVASRKLEPCEAVADEIRALGGTRFAVACHVGDWDAVRRADRRRPSPSSGVSTCS